MYTGNAIYSIFNMIFLSLVDFSQHDKFAGPQNMLNPILLFCMKQCIHDNCCIHIPLNNCCITMHGIVRQMAFLSVDLIYDALQH